MENVECVDMQENIKEFLDTFDEPAIVVFRKKKEDGKGYVLSANFNDAEDSTYDIIERMLVEALIINRITETKDLNDV
jgi:hypothetical protein